MTLETPAIPALTDEQREAMRVVLGIAGSIGGRKGTGKSKTRSKAHYRAAGLKSVAVRRAAKEARQTPEFPAEKWSKHKPSLPKAASPAGRGAGSGGDVVGCDPPAKSRRTPKS